MTTPPRTLVALHTLSPDATRGYLKLLQNEGKELAQLSHAEQKRQLLYLLSLEKEARKIVAKGDAAEQAFFRKRFTTQLENLEEMYSPANVGKTTEKLKRKHAAKNRELLTLTDPTADERTQRALAQVRDNPEYLNELVAQTDLDRQGEITGLDFGADALLDVLGAGAGLTSDQILESLLDEFAMDKRYLQRANNSEVYHTQVREFARAASVDESLRASIVASMDKKGINTKNSTAVLNQLLEPAIRNKLLYLTYKTGLSEEVDELFADVADLGKGGDVATAVIFEQKQAAAAAARAETDLAASYGAFAVPSAEQLGGGLGGGGLERMLAPTVLASLANGDPEMFLDLQRAENREEQLRVISSYSGSSRGRVDPLSNVAKDFVRSLETAPQNDDFMLWRSMRGVETDRPPSVDELLKYNRQARRTARPGYRHKRTGDIREFQYRDMSYGVPTDAGTMFFLGKEGDLGEGGGYVRPEEAGRLGDAAVAGATIVEFDFSNPKVLNAVSVAMITPGNKAAFNDLGSRRDLARARGLYNKGTGEVVLLDGRREVLGIFNAGIGGLVGSYANNSEMADVAGSVTQLQLEGGDNALTSLDGAVVGETFDKLAPYIAPGLQVTSKAPVITEAAELVFRPGQSGGELTLMNVEDGEQQVKSIRLADLVKHRKFDDYADYEKSAKAAKQTPATEKQYKRMTRSRLLSPDRNRNRQARRARVEGGRQVGTGTRFEAALAAAPAEVGEAAVDGVVTTVGSATGSTEGVPPDVSLSDRLGESPRDPFVDSFTDNLRLGESPQPGLGADLPLGGRVSHTSPLPVPQFSFDLAVSDDQFVGPLPGHGGPAARNIGEALRGLTRAPVESRRFRTKPQTEEVVPEPTLSDSPAEAAAFEVSRAKKRAEAVRTQGTSLPIGG